MVLGSPGQGLGQGCCFIESTFAAWSKSIAEPYQTVGYKERGSPCRHPVDLLHVCSVSWKQVAGTGFADHADMAGLHGGIRRVEHSGQNCVGYNASPDAEYRADFFVMPQAMRYQQNHTVARHRSQLRSRVHFGDRDVNSSEEWDKSRFVAVAARQGGV